MYRTLSAIRRQPNHELYQLKLVRAEKPVIVSAVLTQKAVDLGVRFDNDRKDYRFNLSAFLANNSGQWARGTNFESSAGDIRLDLSDRRNRCLVADLKNMQAGGHFNKGMKLNLDEHLGLVDYYHPKEKETYFRLGAKPQTSSKRTLVLCFDGTSNSFSNQNTNVVKFFELLKKDDPERQRVYYQTGVGTYTSPAWSNPFTEGLAKTLDLGLAWYLYQHVIDGYKFLMQTYKDGDQIYIFGFSRGAYTARALAGMLHCVGLLPRHNIEHVPFAYQIYASQSDSNLQVINSFKDKMNTETEDEPVTVVEHETDKEPETEKTSSRDVVPDIEVPEAVAPSNAQLVGYPPDVPPPNNPLKRKIPKDRSFGALGRGGNSEAKKTDPEAYKQTFCTPVMIDFVGVWDTVGSVGAIVPRTLPYINYNPSIRIFRHALALDERRANFVPSLWDHARTVEGQDVREVWFRGQHTDVGGGAPPPQATRAEEDPKFTALSNIPLRWMVQQCLENKTCISFDLDSTGLYREEKVLEYRPAQPGLCAANTKIIRARSAEKKEVALAEARTAAQNHREKLYKASSALDKIDIKHTPFEALGKFSLWRLLEIFPSIRPIQTRKGPKMTHVPNLGKPRMIYRRSAKEPVYVHASVVDFLMSEKGKDYAPRATWRGFDEGAVPPIESFEGNPVTEPKSEREKAALVSVLNLNWKPAPGVWSQFKNIIGRLVGFDQRD